MTQYTLTRTATLCIALFSSMLIHTQALAFDIDEGRAHLDGCDQAPSPPNSERVNSDTGPVVGARYFGATERYTHGVLGDAIEADGLLVEVQQDEKKVCDFMMAGENRVFEDTSPRLVDIDQDGINEVIAVASHQDYGARLELYGYQSQQFTLIAYTDYIGTRNRWLAPVGAADFNDDGILDIAYIETPHLGKRLSIVTPKGTNLEELYTKSAYTNHRIGDSVIWGGIQNCNEQAEIILADGRWRNIMKLVVENDQLQAEVISSLENLQQLQDQLVCNN